MCWRHSGLADSCHDVDTLPNGRSGVMHSYYNFLIRAELNLSILRETGSGAIA
jgi:hypothetical protein